MISNKDLVLYACIAKGSTIVAEFCREPELAETAHGCVEKTPPHHSTFSHTEKNRTYTFLIEDPFAYFAISGEDLDRSELLMFLTQLSQAFQAKIGKSPAKNSSDLAAGCFQTQMDPFFRETLDVGFAPAEPPARRSRDPSSAPAVESPPPEKPSEGLKKKKKVSAEMEKGRGNVEGVDRGGGDFTVQMLKSAPILFPASERQRAEQVWRRHVAVLLLLDLTLCSVLFGIWLWVCRGLQCIDTWN